MTEDVHRLGIVQGSELHVKRQANQCFEFPAVRVIHTLPMTVVRQDRKWLAQPVGGQGSGVITQKEGRPLEREWSTRGTDGKCAPGWGGARVRFAGS